MHGDVIAYTKSQLKAERRAERLARFDRSIRDGLAYSRGVGKRMTPEKGDGGARLAFQMKQIPR